MDEYQDTNHCQYMIIKKLASVFENICVVGDDAQSIYSFRGASIQNILSFEKDYPDAAVYRLEQNYRSSQTIVNAANSVIAKNKDQLQKKVWTANDDGEKIRLMRAVTDNEEGRMVAQNIFEEKMNHQLAHSDFAVLYRTNSQSRSLEEALRKLNIPYRIYGGMSFYQRKEVKDVLAYLRLSLNTQDEEALRRIINYPARGIGKTSMERASVIAADQGLSLWEVISNANSFPVLGSATKKLNDFSTMIRSFGIMAQERNAYDLCMHIVRSTGLLKQLHDDKTVEGMSRYENVSELLNGIKEFVEDDTSESSKDLGSYLQDIALFTDADKEDEDKDKVALMTIHQAKGLEFPYVYVTGLEENLFPSQMALHSRQDLEEERRLFYVAITRAKQQLSLAFATSRFRFGSLLPCEPSRFIDEIDREFLQMDRRYLELDKRSEREERGSSSRNLGRSIRKHHQSQIARPPLIKDFVPEKIDKFEKGMKIEHQRFGKGEIIQLEGDAGNQKALIDFSEFGKKTLVLKFAKLRLL